MLENLYGLSCVESQTLGILAQRGMDVRIMYRDCAMPVKELFFFLIYRGNRQEYFDRITRVQDLAKEMGLLSLELLGRTEENDLAETRQAFSGASPAGDYELPPAGRGEPGQALDAIFTAKADEHILVRVTPEFTKTRLHARGLRDDHYVRVWTSGDELTLLNDIPELQLTISPSEFEKIYAGDYFKLTVLREPDEIDRHWCWNRRVFKAEGHEPFYFRDSDFGPLLKSPNNLRETGVRMRDMAGVYKLLRYRMAAYYGQYVDTDFIRARMPEAEKCYNLFEYYNLKKKEDFELYFDVFQQLNRLDIELQQELKERLIRAGLGGKQHAGSQQKN